MTEVSDQITPGERRELRSIVRGQFKVLRAEVERRKEELKGELESEFLRQYRAQDEAISEARQEADRALNDYRLALEKIARDLSALRPELKVSTGDGYRLGLTASDPNRGQAHKAAVANIPNIVGDAKLRLDREEMDLLRELSVGALQSEQAQEFLTSIPTVGELIPRARLVEIENSITGGES